jgi:hypothetical protein
MLEEPLAHTHDLGVWQNAVEILTVGTEALGYRVTVTAEHEPPQVEKLLHDLLTGEGPLTAETGDIAGSQLEKDVEEQIHAAGGRNSQ